MRNVIIRYFKAVMLCIWAFIRLRTGAAKSLKSVHKRYSCIQSYFSLWLMQMKIVCSGWGASFERLDALKMYSVWLNITGRLLLRPRLNKLTCVCVIGNVKQVHHNLHWLHPYWMQHYLQCSLSTQFYFTQAEFVASAVLLGVVGGWTAPGKGACWWAFPHCSLLHGPSEVVEAVVSLTVPGRYRLSSASLSEK